MRGTPSRSGLSIVALTIAAVLIAIAGHPAQVHARQWNTRLPELNPDPATNNTLVAAFLLAPLGARISCIRLRWQVFQVELASVGLTVNTLGRSLLAIHAGLAGVGAKVHYGDEKRNELGVLVYLLGGTLYWGDPDDEEVDPSEPKLFRDPDAESYLPVNVYYRYNFRVLHVEAGLSAHLWMDIDSGIYSYWPPVQAYVGGGF